MIKYAQVCSCYFMLCDHEILKIIHLQNYVHKKILKIVVGKIKSAQKLIHLR